jgi:hypothetical protein
VKQRAHYVLLAFLSFYTLSIGMEPTSVLPQLSNLRITDEVFQKSPSVALSDGSTIKAIQYDDNSILVTKLNPDGSLDKNFGIQGTRRMQTIDSLRLHTIALKNGGNKILIKSFMRAAPVKQIALQLNIDGTFDETFGSGGLQVTEVTAGWRKK